MELPPAPVSRHDFVYYDDEFYVLVRPDHRHRRSSIPELRAFFNSPSKKPSIKDMPAHWYRAQLIHYGLQPTDNKGTAAIRLLDALNQDTLEVPSFVKQMERDLKKEYNDKKKKKKRANEEGAYGSRKKRLSPPASKWLADFFGPNDDGEEEEDEDPFGVAPMSTESYRRPSARRGFLGSKLNFNFDFDLEVPGGPCNSPKTPPPPMKLELAIGQFERYQSENNHDPESYRGPPPPPPRPSLGLLSGFYHIESQAINSGKCDLVLSFDGTSIRGEFQLAHIEGVLYMEEAPRTVSHADERGYPFIWRGRDLDTGLGIHGPQFTGEMRFLGHGYIEGIFYQLPTREGWWMDCEFRGKRVKTRVDPRALVDPSSMGMNPF